VSVRSESNVSQLAIPRRAAGRLRERLSENLSRWNAAAAPLANRVVGTITADLTRSPNRDTESTLANRIADAQLAATAAAADGGAQIAFMNPGGIRADLTFSQIAGEEQPAR
jgi:5'-nucleotidase